jgi:arylsulfatase A-like enzyme
MDLRRSFSIRELLRFLRLGVWFGIVTGLVEGVGLLLFKHINWETWGRMMHESRKILWISPLVDLFLFSAIALACFILAQILGQLRALRLMVFLFVGLAVYDWLTLTNRLWHLSCLVMAIGAAVAFDRWFVPHKDKALRFWERTSPWLPALLLLVFLAAEGSTWGREQRAVANLPAAAPGSPNVLVIVIDCLRADHVSAYGYSRATSPYIDRLAAEGALFENAIATASWSLPSHASMVTGRYPFDHGAEDITASWFASDSSFAGHTTLGEALERRGYRTGAFSGNRVYFTHDSGFETAFQHFEDYFHSPKDSILRTLYGQELLRLTADRYRYVLRKQADVVNRELVRWIHRDPKRPFLAFLNYFDVHPPYGPPDDYPKPPWELKLPVDMYDAGLKYDDDSLARLMGELDRRNMAKNTLVIVTSDHGESLGQHALLSHSRALYWELLHVPLVIWYPGHVPAGIRVNRPVSTAAIPATVMDLLNSGPASEFPGPPLTRLWNSPDAAANWDFVLSEIARNPNPEEREKLADQVEPTSSTGWMKSLITPQYHLIVHENLGAQFYDWVHDRGEQTNLAETVEGRATAATLSAAMRAMMGRSAPPEFSQHAAVALPLHDGVLDIDPARRSGEKQQPVSDYYRMTVAPGSKVKIEVAAHSLKPASLLDAVVAIHDAQGNVLNTCRNPGDDHLGSPAVPDATPEAFDDRCVNDDSRPGMRDPELELVVPGAGGPLELYVHVLDWYPASNGRKNYRLRVTGTQPAP